MLGWDQYAKILITVLIVLDPLMASLIFANLTAGDNARKRFRVALTTSSTVFVLLAAATLAGDPILAALGISLPSFRIAGGILLFIISISMLQAQPIRMKQTPEETVEAADREEIAIVPLAIPLLAGPGAISAVIVFSNMSPSLYHKAAMCSIVLIVSVILWVILRLGGEIARVLGRTGIRVADRLIGLLLAAFAIEFIAVGIRDLYHELF